MARRRIWPSALILLSCLVASALVSALIAVQIFKEKNRPSIGYFSCVGIFGGLSMAWVFRLNQPALRRRHLAWLTGSIAVLVITAAFPSFSEYLNADDLIPTTTVASLGFIPLSYYLLRALSPIRAPAGRVVVASLAWMVPILAVTLTAIDSLSHPGAGNDIAFPLLFLGLPAALTIGCMTIIFLARRGEIEVGRSKESKT